MGALVTVVLVVGQLITTVVNQPAGTTIVGVVVLHHAEVTHGNRIQASSVDTVDDLFLSEGDTMKTLITAACIAATAIALAPTASADDTDTLAAALAANGVPAVSGLEDLVKTAHDVCAWGGGDAAVEGFMTFSMSTTPISDVARRHRTAVAFVRAADEAFCPNLAGQVGFHGKAHFVLTGANAPAPAPLPSVPDAQPMNPPPAAVAPQPKPAPPQVGAPPGGGGGGGGTGGGTGGGCHQLCKGPGIVQEAP